MPPLSRRHCHDDVFASLLILLIDVYAVRYQPDAFDATAVCLLFFLRQLDYYSCFARCCFAIFLRAACLMFTTAMRHARLRCAYAMRQRGLPLA